MLRTSKKLFKLWAEKKVKRIAIDSFDRFFTQQFSKAYDNREETGSEDTLMTCVDLTSISTVKFTAKDTKVMMDSSKTWSLIEGQEEMML